MSNCCVCHKYLKVDEEAWICEVCGYEHHPKCSGYAEEGFGEYASESELSICKKCCGKSSRSHGKVKV